QVLETLARQYAPRLIKHLGSIGIELSMFTVQWLVCLFSYSTNKATCIRLWDVFFVEGITWIFKLAISFLLNLENVLLTKTDF
ncbi:MAG: hypothetical protein V2I33_20935, partial [Kangiellaceae bacterium]|nr:hypothetical protein [Kangiellaceae bacterium]